MAFFSVFKSLFSPLNPGSQIFSLKIFKTAGAFYDAGAFYAAGALLN
jgi:hypothetical protein